MNMQINVTSPAATSPTKSCGKHCVYIYIYIYKTLLYSLYYLTVEVFSNEMHRNTVTARVISMCRSEVRSYIHFQTFPRVACKGCKSHFKGGPPVKLAFRGIKYTFFEGVPLVSFEFQGLNITFWR